MNTVLQKDLNRLNEIDTRMSTYGQPADDEIDSLIPELQEIVSRHKSAFVNFSKIIYSRTIPEIKYPNLFCLGNLDVDCRDDEMIRAAYFVDCLVECVGLKYKRQCRTFNGSLLWSHVSYMLGYLHDFSDLLSKGEDPSCATA